MSHYKLAHKSIFGNVPFVSDKYYGLFSVLEDDLRDDVIPFWEYSNTVVRILHKWAIGKGFDKIPVSVFCGKWAMKRFMRVWKSSTVKIDTSLDDEEYAIFNSELLVAREYIQRNLGDTSVRMRTVVDDVRILVDEVWFNMYNSGNTNGRPIDEVIDCLCDEFGINCVYSYNDIIHTLQRRTGRWQTLKSIRSIVVSD